VSDASREIKDVVVSEEDEDAGVSLVVVGIKLGFR
jgi:hypothetical protein